VAPVNPRTGRPERGKHQFYLVEHLPLNAVAALEREFPGRSPPFQWAIAVLSDVRGFRVLRAACVRLEAHGRRAMRHPNP
jgi:hypothetical protein